MPQTILVTGASRGLGLEFARQLSARNDVVLGTTHSAPDKANQLARLSYQVLTLDLTDPESIAAVGEQLGGRAIDILINNAGVLYEDGSIADLNADELRRAFMVNAIGPVLLTRALLPNLRAGGRKLVFNISSKLGSVSLNRGGSSYSYRASKAALNQFTVSLAHELRPEGFTCVVVHPGWVQTAMGGPGATLTPEQSVRSLLTVMDGLTPADSGRYINHDGRPIEW